MSKIHIALAALVVSMAFPAIASAGSYSGYTYSTTRGYGHRTYSYYSATYRTYRSHVAVYHPRHRHHVYYYNTHTNKYWGRYCIESGKYQMLPDAAKKPTIAEIGEDSFLPEGPMPAEEAGGEAMLPPPEPTAEMTPAPTPAPSPAPAMPTTRIILIAVNSGSHCKR